MSGVIASIDGAWIAAFLGVTCVLGGAAAAASGRAVAHAWRPFGRVPLYMFPLTGAVGFLHYALFGLPAIPAGDIAAAVAELLAAPAKGLADLARALAYAALIFVVLSGFGWLGHRLTRAGQMARQYGFMIERQGLLGLAAPGRVTLRRKTTIMAARGGAPPAPERANRNSMERTMKHVIRLACVLAASVALAGAARADVKLGVFGPITGPSAAFGAQLKNGAEQAVADINGAGGILGQKIALLVGDDVSDPKQGVSVANKFVGDGVKFVVGAFNSGVSIPSSDVFAENGILQITPASTNPNFTERGLWNVFRTCGRDDQQGKVAAEYILKNMKGKKIAIVHDKTTYGKGLADEMRKAMNAGGMKEVLYEGVNAGEKDYSAIVSKIKQSGADLVYWGGLHTEGGLIVRQMRDQGVQAPIMGGDGITSAEFSAIAGPGSEGTLMTYGPDPTKKPAAASVVKEFEQKKVNPEAYTLYSYAAVQVYKQAAEQAKSLDPKKVAEAMHSGMTFDTVIGKFAFDKKGDRTDSDYVMYIWKKMPDGKISYVEM